MLVDHFNRLLLRKRDHAHRLVSTRWLELRVEVTGQAIKSAYSLKLQHPIGYTVGSCSRTGIQLAER